MKAREIMTKDPAACGPNDTAEDVARTMRDQDCGCVPVVDASSRRLLGIVTDRDLAMRVLAEGLGPDARVRELMSPDPCCCSPDDDLRTVEKLMSDNQVRRVPVVDEQGCCVGIISQADLAMAGMGRDVVSDREAVVDARYPMEELNERFELGVAESTDYDSVGGYVYATLGEVPEAGESFDSGDVHFTVDKVDGRRIVKVRLQSRHPWPDEVLVGAGMAVPGREERPSEERAPSDVPRGAEH